MTNGRWPCPTCGESIPRIARTCRFCNQATLWNPALEQGTPEAHAIIARWQKSTIATPEDLPTTTVAKLRAANVADTTLLAATYLFTRTDWTAATMDIAARLSLSRNKPTANKAGHVRKVMSNLRTHLSDLNIGLEIPPSKNGRYRIQRIGTR